MSSTPSQRDVRAGRLDSHTLTDNFSDLHPPLDHHEALVESGRCYFCYDAPCTKACPTDIDIPLFIRQISTGDRKGSAKTIFEQNILGGMCARVCPTETLCEEVCVRQTAEDSPVKIGQLQRYATDMAIEENIQFFDRSESTGKTVAVIGAGPAGLACAHRLAMHGHQVTVFDKHSKPGGLNEYGIASYKAVDNFAQREVEYITAIGGIEIKTGQSLGRDLDLNTLAQTFDAVFIGVGLGDVNDLGLPDKSIAGVEDAVSFIARLRQSESLENLPIGNRVVVIGGGMTAIDAAVQSKLLGAREVTIAYRRDKSHMSASEYEQELATAKGVFIRYNLQPKSLKEEYGQLSAIELEYTQTVDGKLERTGETLTLEADQLLVAIGQRMPDDDLFGGLVELQNGRIQVDADQKTSHPKIWAGGDCVHGSEDLTVSATAMGRDAAQSIHIALAKGT